MEGRSGPIGDHQALKKAVKDEFDLSLSRYVATNGKEKVLPWGETALVLAEANEEERAEADRELDKVLAKLGFRGWRDE